VSVIEWTAIRAVFIVPGIWISAKLTDVELKPNWSARKTGINPLAASPIKVRIPWLLPTTLATFVAPTFPLPALRTSTPDRDPNRYPVGTEPRR